MTCQKIGEVGILGLSPGFMVYLGLLELKNPTPTLTCKKTIGASLCVIPVIGILAGAIALVYYRRSWVTPIRNLSCPWKKGAAIAGVSLAGIVGTAVVILNLIICRGICFDDGRPSSQYNESD